MSFIAVNKDNCPLFMDRILEVENDSFQTPWSLNNFINEIENPLSHFWVSISDEILSGYLCFWMFQNEIQLLNIAVHTKFRRKGIGYHLLIKLIESGINKGIRDLWLEVRPSNSAAKSLYDKLGFEEVSRRPRYYRDTNEDAIIMALRLK